MVLLPYMNWGNLKLFLRQCELVEANNPQVTSGIWDFVPIKSSLLWHLSLCHQRNGCGTLLFSVIQENCRGGSPTSVCLASHQESIPGFSEGRKLSPLIRVGAQLMHPEIIATNRESCGLN